VNFALQYPFGYQFAPRYKDLCAQVVMAWASFSLRTEQCKHQMQE
jgi:uncharacterized protein YeaC (DUF1315 family)